MTDIVTVTHVEEGIFQLRMDDPENENRLSPVLCRELMTALEMLAAETALKVLLLSGRKDVFCAGATLQALKDITSGKTDVKDVSIPERMLGFPAPIVGVLEGHAVGGGLLLALCCDVLVASESSRYGVNFTSMGFTPGMGTMELLPALVGHHFASEMILTAKFYKGRELKGRGLFNYVVAAAQVREVALDLARRMAEKPRHALEMVKETLSLPRRQALQRALSREHLMHQVCFSRPGIDAYIERTYIS